MTCKICDFLYNVALSLDESGNVVLFGFIKLFTPINAPDAGGAHYTISQVVAEMRERNSKVGFIACKLLTLLFKPFNAKISSYDHCASALDGVKEGETNG